jgi:hypothetical protein
MIQLGHDAYKQLIEEDIAWLLKNNSEPSLEKDHIVEVLRGSIKLLYK